MTRGRFQRGYTIVELLMSLSVLAIGVSGVIAMQRVTLETNRYAKDLAIATRIAEAWTDQLTTDGSLWTVNAAGASTLPNTTWLNAATLGTTGTWALPAYSAPLGFGPAFGALGQPLDPAGHPELAQFCAHIRLAYLHSDTLPTVGNGVIRAQVRVFWRRNDQAASTAVANICAVTPATLDTDIGAFHVIYLTTSIRQLPVGRVN